MPGLVGDLKALVSGQWVQELTKLGSFAVASSTLLVYVTAALAGNTSASGSTIILCLRLVSVGFLGLSNSVAKRLGNKK